MASNLIIGTGIATLELGINPFVALCGRPDYPEVRLNLSYFVRGLGGTVSQFVVREPIFGSFGNPRTLIIAQWEYLGLAVLCLISMLVIYYLHLPDAEYVPSSELLLSKLLSKNSNEDLSNHSSGWGAIDIPRTTRFKFNVTYIILAFGIATQLFYKPVETSIGLIQIS